MIHPRGLAPSHRPGVQWGAVRTNPTPGDIQEWRQAERVFGAVCGGFLILCGLVLVSALLWLLTWFVTSTIEMLL